jgi:tRNA dimethylallyltransferase
VNVGPRRILVIAGPTASGKSRLAIDVARAFRGTVINADSMQVYRELRVLTARPDAAAEAAVPHRLFGVLPAAERCSVGRWLRMAALEIEAALADARLPIVVGGTGLYLKALLEGLAPIPEIPAEIVAQARTLHARLGGPAFRDAVAHLDPSAAARIAPGDEQRLVRAFSVARATGRPLSVWQREGARTPVVDAAFAIIALVPPRDVLYAAIDERLDAMVRAGALDEARRLAEANLDSGLPAMKVLGVREFLGHVRGEIGLDEALCAARRRTRNYAKRQITWLRHQLVGARVENAQYSESLWPEIFSFIRHFLLTGHA